MMRLTRQIAYATFRYLLDRHKEFHLLGFHIHDCNATIGWEWVISALVFYTCISVTSQSMQAGIILPQSILPVLRQHVYGSGQVLYQSITVSVIKICCPFVPHSIIYRE